MTQNKAVLLDRDGVIIQDCPDYIHDPKDLELIPRSAQAIALLNKKGYKVIVVSNQSGVGRRYFTLNNLKNFSTSLKSELSKYNAHIDAEYYCVHHPNDNCDCRKPKIGMFKNAASYLNIDMSQSFMIGDRNIDMEAGKKAGCTTIKVRTGHGKLQGYTECCDCIVDDLFDAVIYITLKPHVPIATNTNLYP